MARSDWPSGGASGGGVPTGGTTGQLLRKASATDLDTAWASIGISNLAAPTGSVSWASQLLTSLLDPVGAQDAATKAYVDSVATGLDAKQSVKCATTANITLSGEQTLDGILTAASRVLVKNQTTTSQNGLYVSSAGAWTRATDMDAWTEVPGAFTFIEQGTLYADTAWVCIADAGGTIGSTAITWSQFSGAGTYTAGTGLTLTGTQFAIDATVDTLTGVQTLTNKTLTAPVLTAPVLGTPASGVMTNVTGLPVATGISGLATGIATFLGTPTSANLAAALTDETGSGAAVFATSPTLTSAVLVTAALGTPASGTLTNATGLPVSTGVSGLGTGVATFLATPTSANLAAAMTDETGTGANVFATSPTLVTPVLGTVAAGSVLTNATGLPLTTGVTGVLPVANGGTSGATAAVGFRALAEGVGSTQGQILYRDATQWTALGTGTSGQVLQTGGAGANPSWVTASGSGTVTSISPGAGTTTDVTANAPGSAITASGTLSAAHLVNAQTGTTYTVVDGDRAKNITFSNIASVAVTLPQAGQATSFKTGWFVDVRNLNRGTVTITPATSTINGAATLVLERGQGARIVSDGTNYQTLSFGPKVTSQQFTASGTYTPAVGMTYCILEAVGGGGGGGGATTSANQAAAGGGGGGGGYSRAIKTASQIGASQTVTVGAAGAGGAAGANNGSAGGDTSVGTLCIGKGGSGGIGASTASSGSGGAGGIAGTGDVATVGGGGATGVAGNTSNLGGFSGSGGSSVLGGGGSGLFSTGTSATGNAGGVYGGGGGGGASFNAGGSVAGGAGAAGIVIVTEFID